MTTFPGFAYLGWENRPSTKTPVDAANLQGIEERIINFVLGTTGLVNPEKYGAVMDGATDDTAAFKLLHEAVNAGTIKGYYVPRVVKLTAELPVITVSTDIRFYGRGMLDFSAGTWGKTVKLGLGFEGSLGAVAALTADAAVAEFELSCATAYSDGQLLMLYDTLTVWDNGQKARPGEIVEVGRPDGGLAGINGSTNTAAGVGKEKIKELAMTNLNPLKANGESLVPATGEVELEGGQKLKYESWASLNSCANFKLEGEPEVTTAQIQGAKVTVVAPAGKVFLRTPVTHEFGFTEANAAKVQPMTAVEVHVDNARIKGAGNKGNLVGIHVKYGRNCRVKSPVLEDCWVTGVRYLSVMSSHVSEPFISNARLVEFGTGGLQGYGVNFSLATQDCSVIGGRSFRTRHSYTQGGVSTEPGLPRRNHVIDHISESTFADSYDSHGGAYDVHFTRCISVNSQSNGWNINCPKATLTACRSIKSAGVGHTFKNQSIGRTEYDIDIQTIEPRASNAYGLKFSPEGTTWGTEVKYVKVKGVFDGCSASGVEILGSSAWNVRNVDVDVLVRNGGSNNPSSAVLVEKAEGIHIKVRATGYNEKRSIVKLKEVKEFVVDCGPLGFAAEHAENRGVKVEAECVKGVIREGTIKNLGTGKSTELTAASVEKVFVYPGPDEAVENKGAATCKVCTIP